MYFLFGNPVKLYPGIMKILIVVLGWITAIQVSSSFIEHELEEDPSIWSIKSSVDYFYESYLMEQNRKLSDSLVKCIDSNDWPEFEKMLQKDVEDWRLIPNIDEIVDAVVKGRSLIIYDLFISDERIKKDKRIRELEVEFFHHENSLTRLAMTFDSGVFNCFDDEHTMYQKAEEIFSIEENIPESWYFDSLPPVEMIAKNPRGAVKIMSLVVKNPYAPKKVVHYLIMETAVSLEQIPLRILFPCNNSLHISLLGLADFYGNDFVRQLLLNSGRYNEELSKMNLKIDMYARNILYNHLCNN